MSLAQRDRPWKAAIVPPGRLRTGQADAEDHRRTARYPRDATKREQHKPHEPPICALTLIIHRAWWLALGGRGRVSGLNFGFWV